MSLTPKEIISKDMTWTCPIDCRLETKNFYTLIPNESVFRVYIQINATDWTEAIHLSQQSETSNYFYTLYDDSLQIYSYTDEHKKNIKILH